MSKVIAEAINHVSSYKDMQKILDGAYHSASLCGDGGIVHKGYSGSVTLKKVCDKFREITLAYTTETNKDSLTLEERQTGLKTKERILTLYHEAPKFRSDNECLSAIVNIISKIIQCVKALLCCPCSSFKRFTENAVYGGDPNLVFLDIDASSLCTFSPEQFKTAFERPEIIHHDSLCPEHYPDDSSAGSEPDAKCIGIVLSEQEVLEGSLTNKRKPYRPTELK